jgi:L-serine/L-threonine ammonia-lyase
MKKNEKLYIETPLYRTPGFSIEGKDLSFKMEAYQPTGSFKIRGVEYACRDALAKGATALLSSSGGNAGLAVAYAGYRLSVPVTVVLPTTSAAETISKLESLNSEVIIAGDVWDESHEYCLELCEKRSDIAYIPPFDHPKLWEGHATMIDELAVQCDKQPDLIVVSVGGGGLLCGVIEGLVRNGWQDTAVIAAETIGADSLYQSWLAGHAITLDSIDSVATCLGAKRVADKALENVKKYNVTPFVVEDARAVSACLRFADETRVLVEPACGATLAVVLDKLDVLAPYKNIVAIACGGANVSLGLLERWKAMFDL